MRKPKTSGGFLKQNAREEARGSSSHISALTSLRFFAAASVVLFHFGFVIPYPPGLKQLAGIGPVSVCFFFVLSGFILTYTYHNKFSSGMSGKDFWQFSRARFARVYPMHFLTLFAITPVTLFALANVPSYFGAARPQPIGAAAIASSFLQELALVQVYTVGSQSIWNAPAWSIACEAFFYLCFPFIITYFNRFLGLKNIYYVVVVIFMIQLILHIFAVKFTLSNPARFDIDVYTFPILRMWEFLIGCAVGIAFLRSMNGEEIYLWNARRRDTVLALSLLSIGALGFLKWLAPDDSTHFAAVLGHSIQEYVAYTLPFAALIYAVASGPTFLSRLLEHPTLVLLGEASYSLYITHGLAFISLDVAKHAGHNAPPALVIMIMLALLPASVGFLKLIEMPAREWLRPRRVAIPALQTTKVAADD